MKCKTCKSKLQETITDFQVEANGQSKQVVNVPVIHCPSCNTISIPDIVVSRSKAYAKATSGLVIDFKECQRKEEEDMTVVTSLLWM